MPLDEYRAKRDFRATREPSAEGGPSEAAGRPIFVVQEHHASTLHYDFRLEAGGVLKSWAVPKGPSMDPSVKRLAVQVEDHPLSYAGFEGSIPRGQYGGGTVSIWDHGTFDNLTSTPDKALDLTDAIESGRLEFALHGGRLRGKFALVRMKGRGKGKPQWLLIKLADEFARAEAGSPAGKPSPRPRAKRADPAPIPAREDAPDEVELTHPDRVLFPEAGLTKGDVFAYYRKVAGHLLPFLKDRPITLERLPDGLHEGAPHFWQKNTPAYYPDWIPRIPLETESGKTVEYLRIRDEATLLYLVNQGAITFHAWASRAGSLDRPDFILFDLDPGLAPFADVIEVARAIRSILEERGLPAFVKTSGKSGLHVLTPWDGAGGFDPARDWARELGERAAEALPEKATVEIRKAKRGDRVYIDVLQNARGHHAVPPYVLRAIPRATASTPLDWREVNPKLNPAAFTTGKVLTRLARRKSDPLAALLASFQGQEKAARP
ncbi:MAG: non-homologous end-joining DNA ligase [Isosphaeraceae bacterium]